MPPTVSTTICFQAQRKLSSGPDLVRRLAPSQADLCCQRGAWDGKSAAEKFLIGSKRLFTPSDPATAALAWQMTCKLPHRGPASFARAL